MQPHEIGHAAAYEAYRTWIHNSSIYEPLSGDIERQREALTGLAVAEASRLLQYSSHPMDNYAYLAASEAAAHTASYIFYQSRDGEYRSRSQHRQSFDDPYALDDTLFSRTRSQSAHGHRSRSRSSFSRRRGIPYSSSSASFSGLPGSYGSYHGGISDSYHGGISDSYHGGIPVSTPYPPHSVAGSSYGSMPMIGPPYSAPPPDVASSYQGSSLGAPVDYPRSRSSSFSYSQQGYPQGYGYSQDPYQRGYSQPYAYGAPYMGSAMSSSGVAGPAPTTIIIHKSRKSKSRRSRSTEPNYRSSSGY